MLWEAAALILLTLLLYVMVTLFRNMGRIIEEENTETKD